MQVLALLRSLALMVERSHCSLDFELEASHSPGRGMRVALLDSDCASDTADYMSFAMKEDMPLRPLCDLWLVHGCREVGRQGLA